MQTSSIIGFFQELALLKRGLTVFYSSVFAACFMLAGCASGTSGSLAAPAKLSTSKLESFGSLYTTTVEVAGVARRFIVDTGGGMTVFSPALAAEAGCRLGGPLTGFRMSGERVEMPRCEGAQLSIQGWNSRPHTVMVLDINKFVPPDWPRVDGLLSLSTFEGHVLTIDFPGRQLVVDDRVPTDAHKTRVRFERAVSGLSLVSFIASRHGDADLWFEVDTGSDSTLILNEALAPGVGVAVPSSAAESRMDIHIDEGAPIRTPVETKSLIFDGNIGLGTMGSWALTFDLAKEHVWIRRP